MISQPKKALKFSISFVLSWMIVLIVLFVVALYCGVTYLQHCLTDEEEKEEVNDE